MSFPFEKTLWNKEVKSAHRTANSVNHGFGRGVPTVVIYRICKLHKPTSSNEVNTKVEEVIFPLQDAFVFEHSEF